MGHSVLVTGHRGYIGSVLTPLLLEKRHEVIGLDTDFFGPCTLVADRRQAAWRRSDIRDVTADDLSGFDAIVHLAALSNDPIGSLRSDWTDEINLRAPVRLAAAAREAGVRRFLFSSSCIMYRLTAGVPPEESPLDP